MKISIITFNISADFLDPPGVPTWDDRKKHCADVLRNAGPDIIGLQEVTPRQFQFLKTELSAFNPLTVPVSDPTPELLAAWQAKYEKFGFPTIPSPYEIILFYHKTSLALVSSGHWWLSPTPDRPSIGFGNTAPRVVLWAHFQHTASQQEFVLFNTHIDLRSIDSMVDLCRKKFAAFAETFSSLFLIGDLNFNEGNENYEHLISDGWSDSYKGGHESSPSTFAYHRPGIPRGRIDHILYRSNEFRPKTWARLLPTTSNQRISDHDPVHVEFEAG